MEWHRNNLDEHARSKKQSAVGKDSEGELPAAGLKVPGNRSRERARHNPKGCSSYLILASVRRRPRAEGEKRQRSEGEVKAQKDRQMDSAEITEETLHSRRTQGQARWNQ